MWRKRKLQPPALPATPVERPRLYSLLDKWPSFRVILIRAAAGYGKSSLVSTWQASRAPANSSRIAWLSLESDDSDPVQFMRYFATALDAFRPGLVESVRAILDDAQPDPLQAMSALLVALEATHELPYAGNSFAQDEPLLLIL